MKKILIVFGTRPEAIKMAPLVKEFQKFPQLFDTKVCVTAQHREMLDQVLDFFEITPDFDLNIMKEGQDLYDVTSAILQGMKKVLDRFVPDMLFVHGDTTTTFSASLAAFYKKIPVSHIEAGLRTGNIYAPWPEEANRKLTSQITSWHFATTQHARDNLIHENIAKDRIFVTGNTVIDALQLTVSKIHLDTKLRQRIEEQIEHEGYNLARKRKFILVTGHRRENFGEGFLQICMALKEIALNNTDLDIVYPVHLNPNVQKPAFELLANVPNIYLFKPLDYIHFVHLMFHSFIIITDSGGVQEEAPTLGKPVLVMREETERPEAVDSGSAILVGTSKEKILRQTQLLIDNIEIYETMSKINNPYGDGRACETIVSVIRSRGL